MSDLTKRLRAQCGGADSGAAECKCALHRAAARLEALEAELLRAAETMDRERSNLNATDDVERYTDLWEAARRARALLSEEPNGGGEEPT